MKNAPSALAFLLALTPSSSLGQAVAAALRAPLSPTAGPAGAAPYAVSGLSLQPAAAPFAAPRPGPAIPALPNMEPPGVPRVPAGRGGGAAFAPLEPGSRPAPSVRLDPPPAPPSAPQFQVRQDRGGPLLLPGDPRDAAGVEAALRVLVQSRPEEFAGVAPARLTTVLAHSVAGAAGLADTVYVNFKQLHNGLEVEGSYLSFTVRLGGAAVVVASSARLYPELTVDESPALAGPALFARAAARLGRPAAEPREFHKGDVRVMHLGGRWRSVSLFSSKADGLTAAVDVADGTAFAWDERRTAGLSGSAQGRGIADGPIERGTPVPLALAHLEVVAPDGKTYYADAEGRFVVPGEGADPVQLTLRLSGRYAQVAERQRDDLVVEIVAKPGEEVRAVFNPKGQGENALAQVNGYVHTTLVHDFLARNGVAVAALDVPLPVMTNLDDECNAFYTPRSPSLNLFFSSARCANSSYGDVIYHEYGHFFDEAAHRGLGDGALSEAIGDILTMLITGQPVVGRGFKLTAEPDYIRHGGNGYRYGTSPEVHAQGQAGMGFVWKLRQAFVDALGEAEGAALTTALVLPALLAVNRDIPAFINSVLARDMNAAGAAPHFKEIAAAAATHGIELRPPDVGGLKPPSQPPD